MSRSHEEPRKDAMTDDRKLALTLSDLTEEHLLGITHAMRSQRDKAREQGNERLAEVFGSILSLALAAAVSNTVNMLGDADFRDHVARTLVATTDRDRRFVRRIAVETRQLAEEQPDGHAVAKSMAELVVLVDAAETEARRSKR